MIKNDQVSSVISSGSEEYGRAFIACNVQCACNVKCAMCNVQCAMCNVQCAMCNVQCAMCNVQWQCSADGRGSHVLVTFADKGILLRSPALAFDSLDEETLHVGDENNYIPGRHERKALPHPPPSPPPQKHAV
jgi:hypothetical protein